MFSEGASNSQKPPQRLPGPPRWLRRSKKGFQGSRQLSKAASTPPKVAVAGNSQKPPQHPQSRRNVPEEARRVSAVAGNSQKPSQRPPGPPKRLRRSEKVSRGSRQLSKAASTPPGAAETAPENQEDFPRLPAPLKSRFNAPRSRRKWLRRSEEGFRR
jgi:hypothetical protein